MPAVAEQYPLHCHLSKKLSCSKEPGSVPHSSDSVQCMSQEVRESEKLSHICGMEKRT